jgi:hypothetical protein
MHLNTMPVPLRLKWLGRETEEVCSLIAPFHPLILVSPVPRDHRLDFCLGLIPLPLKICRVFELREKQAVPPATGSEDLVFEALELADKPESAAALYQFYFDVYLRNSALKQDRKTSDYRYLEPFHLALLEHRFIVLIRALRSGRTVAGLLLRRPTSVELKSYRENLHCSRSIEETDLAIVDVLSTGASSGNMMRALVQHAAQWARESGNSFLSSLPVAALFTAEHENEEDCAVENEAITVWQNGASALLYCDISRCSYFETDVYYYSLCGKDLSLNYVANVLPQQSVIRLLKSTPHVKKKVYTRHPKMRAALLDAGIECEFLDSASVRVRRLEDKW